MNMIMANDNETSRSARMAIPANKERNEMAFMNEVISDEDRKKYQLDELDGSQAMRGKSPQREWTIDSEHDIYLREIGRGREEGWRKSTWHFYWKGELMTVCVEITGSGGDEKKGGHHWVSYQLVDCYKKGFFIPEHLLDRRDEIIADLKAALSKNTEGGVYSPSYYGTYETTLEV